jgi:hypothetical protein
MELQLTTNRRRSDVSSSSLSNRSRELSVRGDTLPLFICFICRLMMKDYDYNAQVKSIPLCISKKKFKKTKTKISLDFDFQR